MPGLDRRQFLGAGAALALTGLPDRASAALIANRSGLPWASGGRDKYPDVLAAYRGRNLDVLTVYGPRGTWSDIRNTGSKLAWLIGQRSETIVISYPMFPNDFSPKTYGSSVWTRAANGEFDLHHDAAAAGLAPYAQKMIFRVG